jgi:hypothetical protein
VRISEVVSTYGAAWNEPDEGARRKLLEQAWADDGVYCDPTATADGRDALVAHIAGFHELFPGARIELVSGVDEHDGWLRFAWALVGADGATLSDGFDVGELAPDGRLRRIVGFFGPFPPLEG